MLSISTFYHFIALAELIFDSAKQFSPRWISPVEDWRFAKGRLHLDADRTSQLVLAPEMHLSILTLL